MESKSTIVFFGSSKYIIPTIKMLHDNFTLGLVVTTEKNPTDAVPAFCNENDIPFLSVKSLKEQNILEKIRTIHAEVAVLGYFGLIIPSGLLSIFPKGIVNIHPSLLPIYRGPTPVQTSILNGDSVTGVSIILLDDEVDHGPILTQQKEKISPTDTTDSLHSRLFSIGSELIKEILPKYLLGEITPTEQDHDSATLTKELNKSDGQFDINNPPDKDKLNRIINAFFPWPTAWTITRIKNKEVRIKLLPEKKIQVEGGKPMSIKDFLNGYPEMKNKISDLKL